MRCAFMNNMKITYVEKMRNGIVFDGMQVKETLSRKVFDKHTDIIVFEMPESHICRDLIVYDGSLYHTDLYNGLMQYDRLSTEYVFLVV